MGIFKRLFKIGKAEAHSTIDKLENPIKMTEQGIRDLKEQLTKSIEALAQVKALAIRTKNEANSYKTQAENYENKAIELLQRSQKGALDQGEADRLATSALAKKEQSAQGYKVAMANYEKYDVQVQKLETSIKQLKANVSKWEAEAKMLKARAKVSEATKEVNKQLAGVDSSSTIAMLERMKEKVETQEALSESYGELALENRSLDDEIDSVLEETNSSGSDALLALKNKLAGQLPENTEVKPEE
ncbi:MAG: PspA/IM30 family protein [Bacteroidales bacterium]|nr:PspA/IM30 family protein [Bacteroidales bacterium]